MNLYYDKTSKSYVDINDLDKLKCKIVDGIPRFVDNENYASPFGAQWKKFRDTQLDSTIGFGLSEDRLRRCLGENLWTSLSGKVILEAGCGAGRFTEILLKKGAIVISIDISDAVEANKNNFPLSDQHYICQADINDLPFKENYFDVVLCLGVVQHTKDSEITIRNLFSYVKEGGTLVFDHYKLTLSFVTRLLPVYRKLLKLINVKNTILFTEKLVKLFFPIHKILGRNIFTYALLSRISPIVTYFHSYPQLDNKFQRDWSIMDTHDSLFDYYKHLKTNKQIETIIQKLQNIKEYNISNGGIGIEVRCYK